MISTVVISDEDGTVISRRDIAGVVELVTALGEFAALGFREYFATPVSSGMIRSNVTVVIQHWEA